MSLMPNVTTKGSGISSPKIWRGVGNSDATYFFNPAYLLIEMKDLVEYPKG